MQHSLGQRGFQKNEEQRQDGDFKVLRTNTKMSLSFR